MRQGVEGAASSEGNWMMMREAKTKQGERMTGAQAVVASLEAAGVEFVFGYPGGYAIDLYDALFESGSIRHVLARHEQ